MARKTNKTDHVLNLLAGGSNDKDETKKRRKSAPPVDPSMNVSVLQTANSEGDPIATAIKNQLEEDLLKEVGGEENLPDLDDVKNSMEEEKKNLPDLDDVKDSRMEQQAEEEIVQEIEQEEKLPDLDEMKDSRESLPDLDEIKDSRVEETPQEAEPQIEVVEEAPQEEEPQIEVVEEVPQEAEPQTEVVEEAPQEVEPQTEVVEEAPQEEESQEAEPQIEVVEEAPQEEESQEAEPQIEVVEEPQEEEVALPEFMILNVMEGLVKRKLPELMERFGNCMCERCICDATAYALTNLPAKYVVVKGEQAIAPLLSFYESKYAGQIMVECTKACIVVKEKPFHEID